jgi:hypothetical protein
MSPRSVSSDATAAVREKLNPLKDLSKQEAAALPPAAESEVSVEGKRHRLVVWHESLASGEDWVVVQLYRPKLFGGVRRVHGEGFAIDAEGKQRTLTATEVDRFTW